MKLKHFILNDENIEKSSYIWNMAGSMLMAFQSVIMLMILTRTVGLGEAGVFTIAYANASLFLNIVCEIFKYLMYMDSFHLLSIYAPDGSLLS